MSFALPLIAISYAGESRPGAGSCAARDRAEKSAWRARKVVNSRRRNSVAADHDFLRNTGRFYPIDPTGDGEASSANKPTTISSPESAPTSPTKAIPPPDSSPPDSTPSARRYVPSLWRDIRVKSRVYYLNRAVAASANDNELPCAFTLNIAPELLKGEEAPANFMQRRIARFLKEKIGRAVDFAGCFEWRTEGAPRLHIHGALSLTPGEKTRAREALRAAGGDWREGPGKGRQVDLTAIYDIDGWSSYITRDLRQTRLELERRRHALGVKSSRAPTIVLASREVQRRAKALYERDRELICAKSSTPPVVHTPAPDSCDA